MASELRLRGLMLVMGIGSTSAILLFHLKTIIHSVIVPMIVSRRWTIIALLWHVFLRVYIIDTGKYRGISLFHTNILFIL